MRTITSRVGLCPLLLAAAVMLSIVAVPVAAQQAPEGSSNPLRLAPAVHSGPSIHRPTGVFVGTPKICFWLDTSGGTAFGKSGFCDAPSGAAIGSVCRCGGVPGVRNEGKLVGKVMAAPQGNGSSQIVR